MIVEIQRWIKCTVRDLSLLFLNWIALSIPSHYGLGNPAEEVEKLYEQAWVEDTKETFPTKNSSMDAQMKSQRLWLYTQDLYGSAQM